MALPLQSLSVEYVIATHCDLNNCFCAVVITENSTCVNIHLRVGNGGVVTYEGVEYRDYDVIAAIGEVGDVIQVTCLNCDLSGTLVTASRNVSVIAGKFCLIGLCVLSLIHI